MFKWVVHTVTTVLQRVNGQQMSMRNWSEKLTSERGVSQEVIKA
jgi:hypothetical protein